MARKVGRLGVILRWVLSAVVIGGLTTAGMFFVWWEFFRPVPITIGVMTGSDDIPVLQAIARQASDDKGPARFTIKPFATREELAAALSRADIDMTVTRADEPLPDTLRVAAIMRQNFVLFFSIDPAIDTIAKLRGKRLAILGGVEANQRLLQAILESQDLKPSDVTVTGTTMTDIPQTLRNRSIDAYMAVAPVTGAGIARFRTVVLNSRRTISLIGIDEAEGIALTHRSFSTDDIKAGLLRARPAMPEEDMTTLTVAHLLVVRRDLRNRYVSAAVRAIFEARQALRTSVPASELIAAADTARDALVAAHPGAAAYFDASEPTFFDEFGNWIYYGPFLISLIISGVVGLWRMLDRDAGVPYRHALEQLTQMCERTDAPAPSDGRAMVAGWLRSFQEGKISEAEYRTLLETYAQVAVLRPPTPGTNAVS